MWRNEASTRKLEIAILLSKTVRFWDFSFPQPNTHKIELTRTLLCIDVDLNLYSTHFGWHNVWLTIWQAQAALIAEVKGMHTHFVETYDTT